MKSGGAIDEIYVRGHMISRVTFPMAKPVLPVRIGAIGDAHASRTWINWMERLDAKVAKTVALGDFVDRGINNLEVVDYSKRLCSQGRMIPLWGNHDLLLTLSALGDGNSLLRWLPNGGNTVIDNIVQSQPFSLARLLSRKPDRFVDERLTEIASWMTNNLKLFHLDEFHTLYIHAGIPLDGSSGQPKLSYNGKEGLLALYEAQKDLTRTLKKLLDMPPEQREFDHKIFDFLNGAKNPDALLWLRHWSEPAEKYGFRGIESLGVDMVVYGHDYIEPLGTIFCPRIPGEERFRIFGIDSAAYLQKGSILINSANHVVLEESTFDKAQGPLTTMDK